MLARLLDELPILEVSARLAYWRLAPVRKLADALRARLARARQSGSVGDPAAIDFAEIATALGTLGVGAGDIMVVHSSYNALKPTGLAPDAINAALQRVVGNRGTLAMPAIPIIRHEPQGAAKFDDAAYDRVFDYDARSTRIATGALPRALMAAPGAARSLHPGNAMVAVGPHAAAMMAGNIDRDAQGRPPTPCGPMSSWAYCAKHGAKIVALGVDLVHSLTAIHVAEDAYEDAWPVAGWYRERRFTVRDGDTVIPLTIRERRHGWSQHYAERRFAADLYRTGIARRARIGTLSIEVCDADRLVDYLRRHPHPAYPYVFPLGFARKA